LKEREKNFSVRNDGEGKNTPVQRGGLGSKKNGPRLVLRIRTRGGISAQMWKG